MSRKGTLAALGALVAIIAIGRTARPLVPEAERLTGADLPTKHLVFTIDRGPSVTTPDLSNYLLAHKIKATFFIDGAYSEMDPAILELIADGHLVGNRAVTNRDVTEIPLDEVVPEFTATDERIAPYVAWNRKFLRAPFGKWTRTDESPDAGDAGPDAIYNLLSKTKLKEYIGPIFWNVDADCTTLTAADCADAYLQRIHAKGNGIVRFDDTETTFAALKLLVPQLETEGYVFDGLEAPPAIAAMLETCDDTCAACTGPLTTDCNACPQGTRLSQGQCLTCAVCQPGNYVVKACSANGDTLCSPCGTDGYQPQPGSPSCLACGDCSDGNACTIDACHPVNGCTHTKIPGCPKAPDSSVSVPPVADAGGSRPTGGSKIDDENNIAVSADEETGCATGARSPDAGVCALVALCIFVGKRRRGRNRPLSS